MRRPPTVERERVGEVAADQPRGLATEDAPDRPVGLTNDPGVLIDDQHDIGQVAEDGLENGIRRRVRRGSPAEPAEEIVLAAPSPDLAGSFALHPADPSAISEPHARERVRERIASKALWGGSFSCVTTVKRMPSDT
jgi:hypothetical protein